MAKAYESILIVLDKPKHEQAAMEYASYLQARTGARVGLASFCWHPMVEQSAVLDSLHAQQLKKGMLSERDSWLQDLRAQSGMDSKNVTTETVWTNDIARWVAAAVMDDGHDLVVKSVHHSESFLHTRLDWRLILECPAPLLMVSNRHNPQRSGNVLASLDLRRQDVEHQALNLKILDAASYVAKLVDGTMHCVYVMEFSEVLHGLDVIDVRSVHEKAEKKASSLLDALIEPYGISKANVHIPDGKVERCVQRVVHEINADLLVVGTSANKGLTGALLGNSAERILTKAPCNVLVIKP